MPGPAIRPGGAGAERVKLFTALWPSPEVVGHLDAALRALDPARVAAATRGCAGSASPRSAGGT
ncbi:hypothetical protein [Saccharopolyspora sp. CA-218241]|uniref:hypothetical protein n=1 Tax=Saccharopolyspora sp. CA-218241 TaxID=3240027 RepID=UPI003D98C102